MLRKRAGIAGLVWVLAILGMGEAWAVVSWDSGGTSNYWSDRFNWSGDQVPTSTDDVYISSTDDIDMDLGTPTSPYTIASLDIDGTQAGSLTILSNKGFKVTGDFEVSGSAYEFIVGSGSSVEVGGALLMGGTVTINADSLLDAGTGQSPGRSDFSGTWTLNAGATVTFHAQAGASDSAALTMHFVDGATLVFENSPFETDTTFYTGSTDQERTIDFEGSGNVIEIPATDVSGRSLQLGYHTVLKSLANDAELTLLVSGTFDTWSFFYYEFVRENWDSRQVDIEPVAIDEDDPEALYHRYETISTDLEDYFEGDALVFTDVACAAGFDDLTLESPVGYTAAPTLLIDEWDNSYTDELSNTPGASGDAEAFLFHDVTIESGRALDFPEFIEGYGQVRLYYWGTRTIDGTVLYGGQELGEGTPTLDELIVPAIGTLYSDWDASCTITLAELRELSTAIQEELYNPLYDFDCNGELTMEVEYAAAYANYLVQPDCGDSFGGGESQGLDDEAEAVAAALADDLQAALDSAALADFVTKLEEAAAKFTGTQVGAEMAALLGYLE